MKASVFHKPGDIRVDTVPDPEIKHPHDIIQKVASTAICGSDLPIYNGFLPQKRPMVLGHEFMGIVKETGAEVGQATVQPIDEFIGWMREGKIQLDDIITTASRWRKRRTALKSSARSRTVA